MSVADRLRQIRAALGLSQGEMSAKVCVKPRAYQGYETGERLPQAESLEALGRMGFNIYWLLTGEGAMCPGGEAAPTPAPTSSSAPVDAELVGRVLEAISAVYKELGWGKSLHQLGAEAVQIAADIAADGLSDPDKPAAVKAAAAMLRRQLRQAVADPASAAATKSQA
jgi:transcriptional regulator with XRE-family HTH domain